jgi:hypothetical protein
MKIGKISILLAVSFGAIMAFSGCEKDDGAIPSNVGIINVPTITTNIDATGSTIINVLSPATAATFAGKFKVDNYFPGAAAPTKVDIVVRKNGSNANVVLYKANVTTLPVTYTVTAAEITALFGGTIMTGDTYDFAPNIYVGTNKYEAFPVTGIGIGTGHAGHPLYGEFARFTTLCQDVNFHQGNFEVVSDAFTNPITPTVGFTPGQVVTLTKVSDTRFTFTAPFVTSPLAIIVNIGATTNILSTTKQKIGNAFTWDLTQTNPNVTVTSGVTNFIEPCAKTIDLNITYSTDQKLFPGTYLLRLRKL